MSVLRKELGSLEKRIDIEKKVKKVINVDNLINKYVPVNIVAKFEQPKPLMLMKRKTDKSPDRIMRELCSESTASSSQEIVGALKRRKVRHP